MAKEKITDKLQAKFDKPHFQIGSAVFFSWLGSKKYGYVTAFKKTNWGIQYTVQSTTGTSYPCGICIEGITTSYKVGIIYLEETRKLGNDVIAGKIESEKENSRIPTITGRTTITNTISDTVDRADDDGNNTTNTTDSGSDIGSVNDIQPSSTRVHKRTTKTRKTSKSALDEVIEKQKNFLNGFVKKD